MKVKVNLPKGLVAFNDAMYSEDVNLLLKIIPDIQFKIVGSVPIETLQATKTLYMAYLGNIEDKENQDMLHILQDVLEINKKQFAEITINKD